MYLDDKICVISANNSVTKTGELIDYIQLASIAAERVKYYLNIPTYLITNDVPTGLDYPTFAGVFHHQPSKISNRAVIAGDGDITYKWFNDARIDAYKLTKGLGRRVLMIDADYMVSSSDLLNWLMCDTPFMMFNKVLDITGTGIYKEEYLPSRDIPLLWATAMCWEQCEEAEVIFETARMVRDNYEFYALMTGMQKGLYRNDIAFSIACHLHNVAKTPGLKLCNIPPGAHVINNNGKWIIMFGNKLYSYGSDIHIINKEYAIKQDAMEQLRLKNVQA